MLRPEVADAVRATCESILSARGVELVTFSLGRESVGQTHRLTVDRPEGSVSLDEIVEISEEVSKALDTEDPIPGRYTLEVASAGIERPLVRPADYRRFQGRRVKVRCEEPIEGRNRIRTGDAPVERDEMDFMPGFGSGAQEMENAEAVAPLGWKRHAGGQKDDAH